MSVRNLGELLQDIIPPASREYREGFNNERIIDELNAQEKELVERELLKQLEDSDDILIAETLGYLGSKNSIRPLYKRYSKTTEPITRIILASILYKLDKGNAELIDSALADFNRIESKYDLIFCFYYLASFQNKKIDSVIQSYKNHSDYLVSYNAKKAAKSSKST